MATNTPTGMFDGLTRSQKKWLVRAVSLALFAIGWELTGYVLGEVLFAPLSVTIVSYIDLAINGDMFPALAQALQEMFIGYAFAVAFAVPLGLVMGRSRTAEKLFEPWISAFFVTSTTAMLPLLLMVFGIGLKMRIVVIWLACVWHILLNVFHGAKGVDEDYIDVGRSFDLSTFKMFKSITLPAIVPYVMAGLRMGLTRAFRGVILAQTYILIGYGGLLKNFGNQSISTAPVLALIITIMIFGSGMTTILTKLQHKLLPWADVDPSL